MSNLTGYAVAIASSLAAVAMRFALQPWIGLNNPMLILILAPLAASFYGTRPALLATGLCVTGAMLFLLEPIALETSAAVAAVDVSFFAIVGVALSFVGGHRIRGKVALQTSQAETAKTRNRLQSILDSVPAFIYQIDVNGNFQFVNRAYAELVGFDAREIIGKHVTQIFNPDDAALYLEHNATLFQGREIRQFEEKATLKDGEHTFSSIKTPLFDGQDRPVALLGVSTDITERIKMENALRQSDARKDEFLAVLGHELRNPLAPLYAGIDLLDEVGKRPELIDDIRAMMKRQVSHLIRLVDDLLNMSRINRGVIELHRKPVDLNQIVPQALEQVMPVFSSRKLHVETEICQQPLWIHGDSDRLTQVVVNLLTNAAKYTEKGGEIRVITCMETQTVVLKVRDTGHGIPARHLESIFDMFSQVPEHKEFTGGGGLGIGLALCRKLVDMHGGSISASSDGPELGAEFTVQLPLDERSPRARH